MNNDMMPLFAFLLMSEEMKKQTERVIQEVRSSNDVKKSQEELANSDFAKTNIRLMQEQGEKYVQLTEAMRELKNKIDGVNTADFIKIPLLAEADKSSTYQEGSKSQKKV